MKIPCNFQVRTTSSCATVRTRLSRRPDAPQCLETSVLQLSGRLGYTVRTLGQATPSWTWSWISDDTIWEGFTRRPDDVVTHPDATQCCRIFWVSFTDAEKSDNVNLLDTRSSCPDAVLFWEEYCYSGKVVAEDRPGASKWPSGRYSPESEFEQNQVFCKLINKWL
jgi:hypothetical protein